MPSRSSSGLGNRRPEQKPGPRIFHDHGDLQSSVGREFVKYHHVAVLQGRGELGFDAEFEEFAVYRAADDPRCVEPIIAQFGDEGLSLLLAERGLIDEVRSALGPSIGLGHFDLARCHRR